MKETSVPNKDIPRPEHPRPDFMRQPWLNLNGRWRFTFDPHNTGEQKRWYRLAHPQVALAQGGDTAPLLLAASRQGSDGVAQPFVEDPFGLEITVPFPWESRLSGLSAKEYKGAAWYQRSIEVPADWAETPSEGEPLRWRLAPFLCFGAVDWHARVWVNGRFAGEHSGGYTPFNLDISRLVQPGMPATLTVRAYDAGDADTLLGKQTYDWYTTSSGIWQTVWLEGRPAAHLSRLHVTPQLEAGKATFAVAINTEPSASGKAYRLTIASTDGSFAELTQEVEIAGEVTETALDVVIPQPKAWSPETPHLYDCTVRLEPQDESEVADIVTTYFGLRSVSRGRWQDNPYEYVFLNGEPVYLRGALDQALYPDALHSYPSDEAIRADVQLAKDLGLNMLRCHIKVNDPRYYYWADKLGVLMMYDLPSTSIYTPTARANWEYTFREALARDYSHPCIFSWILFNETWGLEEHQTSASWAWVAKMFGLAKTLDLTRLVEDNSACLYDHVKTDLNTWHFYLDDYDRARREVLRIVEETYEGSSFNYVGHRYGHVEGAVDYKQGAEPLLNSEYAGLGASGGDKDIAYTFKFLTTELRRHSKICGYVYTELSDIEWEHNGFVNYDRSEKRFGYDAFFPEMGVRDLTGANFVGLDCPPCQTLASGSLFSAPAFVSHWGDRPLTNARLCWRVTAIDRFGERLELGEGGREVQPKRYGVTDGGTVEVRVPDEEALVTVALWLEDAEHRVVARNYVNVDVFDGHSAPEAEEISTGYALRFRPGSFSRSSWPQPTLGPLGGKFGASGSGWVEYEVTLPGGLDSGAVQGLRLLFEAGARTASRRLGWRERPHGRTGNYPQTEAQALPSELLVSVNGMPLSDTLIRLPDDPADARGVLSAHLSPKFEYASYGFLTKLEADAETARRILAASQDGKLVVRFEVPHTAAKRGGLNLYGARMGAFPLEPTMLLEIEQH